MIKHISSSHKGKAVLASVLTQGHHRAETKVIVNLVLCVDCINCKVRDYLSVHYNFGAIVILTHLFDKLLLFFHSFEEWPADSSSGHHNSASFDHGHVVKYWLLCEVYDSHV